MDIRQLRSFVRIIELGNISRAAEQLHVAQPALSAHIHRLEAELQVSLLTRHSRGVEATEAGKLLYERAKEILNLMDQARQDVMNLDIRQPEIMRLGLTPSLMLTTGSEIAVQAREKTRNIKLILFEDMSHALITRIQESALDIALAYGAPDSPHYSREVLRQDRLMLVSLPRPQQQDCIAFSEAIRTTLVLPEPGDVIRDTVTQYARQLGMPLDVAYEVRAISAIKALVLRGKASTILPYSLVAEEVRSQALAAQQITSPDLTRTLYFLTRQDFRINPYLPEIKDLIKDILKMDFSISNGKV